jgi:hypothetical protein
MLTVTALSENPSALHLLKNQPKKINWRRFAKNPAIFVLDYDALKQRCAVFKEELIALAVHPTRIHKWMSMDEDFDVLNI